MPSITIAILSVMGATLISPATSSAGDFLRDTNPEVTQQRRRVRAAQFLHHATFGPTIEQIDELADRIAQVGTQTAFNEWIDDQWAIPATEQVATIRVMLADDDLPPEDPDSSPGRYGDYAWWHNALSAPDQLRQRAAWAMSQILVTSRSGFGQPRLGSVSGDPTYYSPLAYYDLLIHGVGGNYRDLLHDVTYSPVMGKYLTYLRNRKSDANYFPDENYAREIMQLFTIGLHRLDRTGRIITDDDGKPIPTYDNHAVRELAKVFTGLTMQTHEGGNPWSSGWEYSLPMVMHEPRHEPGVKQPFDDLTIGPATGDEEIAAVLDYLFNHENIAPFICYRLIQRMTRSNPSRVYLRRVVEAFEDNGQGVRGDMKAVFRAILTDSQAFQGVSVTRRTDPLGANVRIRNESYSRLREPVLRYTAFLRAMRPTSDYATGRFMIPNPTLSLNQGPYRQPSVFGFYQYNSRPNAMNGPSNNLRLLSTPYLAAPEFQIHTGVVAASWINNIVAAIVDGQIEYIDEPTIITRVFVMRCVLSFDIEKELAIVAQPDGLAELIDELDLLHCRGTTPTVVKQSYVDEIEARFPRPTGEDPDADDGWITHQCQAAMICILTSPYAAIEQ